MISRISILLFSLMVCTALHSQVRNDWSILSTTVFEETFDEEFNTSQYKPKFSEEVLAIEGKEVVLLGYIVTSMETGEDYEGIVFSKYPFENCYFCGGAGPETVAQIEFDPTAATFKLGNAYGFKGKLFLNKDDPDKLTFILKEAELYDF